MPLNAGTPLDLGVTDIERYSSHLPESWLLHTWKCAKNYSIQLMLDMPTMPTLRTEDKSPMDIFTLAGINGQCLAMLNPICLCLHVITVTDIATPHGQCLSPAAFTCDCSKGLRKSVSWLRPLPVTTRCHQTWQWTLTDTLLTPGTRTEPFAKAITLVDGSPCQSTLSGPGAKHLETASCTNGLKGAGQNSVPSTA